MFPEKKNTDIDFPQIYHLPTLGMQKTLDVCLAQT